MMQSQVLTRSIRERLWSWDFFSWHVGWLNRHIHSVIIHWAIYLGHVQQPLCILFFNGNCYLKINNLTGVEPRCPNRSSGSQRLPTRGTKTAWESCIRNQGSQVLSSELTKQLTRPIESQEKQGGGLPHLRATWGKGNTHSQPREVVSEQATKPVKQCFFHWSV